jgi:hypothetical protein
MLEHLSDRMPKLAILAVASVVAGCSSQAIPSSASFRSSDGASVSRQFADAWVTGDGDAVTKLLCSGVPVPTAVDQGSSQTTRLQNIRVIGAEARGPDTHAVVVQADPVVDFHVPIKAEQEGRTVYGAIEVSLEGTAGICVKSYGLVLDR